MKAIVCTKYGPPEVLQLREIEKPVPKDNEVLVKIMDSIATVGDCRIRGFRVPASFWIPARIALGLRKPKKPVLGGIFSGIVEKTGKDVTLFKEGDPVFAFPGHNSGSYAEYICMSETGCIAGKPVNLNFEEAAAIPWGGITALYFLRKARILNGTTNLSGWPKVLIYGASGAVGTSAVQLAKYAGAEVTGVCSTANTGLVKSLGADKVIDYTAEDFTKNGETYDVIFDTVGKSSLSGSIKSLRNGGSYLHAVVTPAVAFRMGLASLVNRKTGKKLYGGTFVPKTDDLLILKNIVEEGKLKPVIDRTYPLEQMVEAHRYVDLGHKKGEVVITV